MLLEHIYIVLRRRFKKGESKMYLKIGLILLVACLVGVVYLKLYYLRFNKIAKGQSNSVSLYKLSPSTVNIALVLFSLLSVTSISLIEVEALDQEVEKFEQIILNDHYRGLENEDHITATVYREYNNYFSGFIIEENQYIIFITEDSPDSLIQMLENANYQYRLVKYNYASLQQLMETVLNEVYKDPKFVSISVNVSDNIVELGLTDTDIDSSIFDHYISENLLRIVQDEPMDTHN